MPTLLIFDCDGTLIDSERLYNLAWADALTHYGLAWSVDECARRFNGRPWPDACAIVAEALGHALPDDFQDSIFAASDRWFEREGLQPIAGVADALARLPQAKCVASSGLYEHVRDNLALTGLLDFFGVERIFTASMVSRGKPAPDVFLHAAEVMGAAPQECIVIEDSVPGVMAGRAAGMRVLGYGGNPQDRAALFDAGAEVFDDMRRLPDLVGA